MPASGALNDSAVYRVVPPVVPNLGHHEPVDLTVHLAVGRTLTCEGLPARTEDQREVLPDVGLLTVVVLDPDVWIEDLSEMMGEIV